MNFIITVYVMFCFGAALRSVVRAYEKDNSISALNIVVSLLLGTVLFPVYAGYAIEQIFTDAMAKDERKVK